MEVGQARREYEKRWQDFSSGAAGNAITQKIAYIDIPWPLDEFASSEQLRSVVFADTLVCILSLYITDVRVLSFGAHCWCTGTWTVLRPTQGQGHPKCASSDLHSLHGTRYMGVVHSQGQVEWRRRLRTEQLRWHPDKFHARFGAALLDADREHIMQRVQAICEVLNAAQPPS